MGLKFYLRKNLPKPSSDYIWTVEENEKLFSYLNKNFSKELLSKKRNKGEIKQAFVDFFEPVGYIIFRMSDDKLNFKIFSYKTKPEDSAHVDTLRKMLIDNEDLIKFNYKDREDQIVIEGKLRRNLYRFIEEIKDENVNKKELLRYVTKKSFELADNDIVIIKKRQIFIKLFKDTKRKDIVDNKECEANRYNGYSLEELEELYDEYFDNENILNFLQVISKQVFADLFLKKNISNKYYEQYIYSFVQENIAQELLEFTDDNIEFRKGFAGYIFRINFLSVFSYIAEELLQQIYLKNEYTSAWLKYYNGQAFVDNNKQYSAPELLTKDNQKWNPSTIYANISIWFKTKENIYSLAKKLKKIEKELLSLHIDGKTPLELQKILKIEEKEILDLILELDDIILEKMDKRYYMKDQEKKDILGREIKEHRAEISDYNKDLAEISQEFYAINSHKEYKKLEENKLKILKSLNIEKKALKTIENKYNSIHSALVKALTSKRKLLAS